jgi:peptidoglycan hydrolase-like protein with peptidoglycan-binding domain
MRTVVIAVGLVVLLAVGWIINGLTSDREKEELAVHYSWIVKWALTLSRESGKAPDRATFDSPRIQVAGDSHRWLVTGRMSWRAKSGEETGDQYSALVENSCKAYADPKCWRLVDFASGEAAIDLAESTLAASAAQTASIEEPAAVEPKAAQAGVAASPPEPAASPVDPVTALLDDEAQPDGASAQALAENAVPAAPAPPLADGVPLPERKPSAPMRSGEEDTLFALGEQEGRVGEADSLAAIEEPSLPAVNDSDSAAALADSGSTSTDADSAFAVAESQPLVAEEDSEAALAEASAQADEDATRVAEAAAPEQSALAGADAATSEGSAYEASDPMATIGSAGDQLAAAAETAPVSASAAAPGAPALLPQSEGSADAATVQPAAPAPAADLVAALPPTPAPAQTGQAGLDPALIVLIQDRLDRAGYNPGPVDGRFGGRTQAALIQFQRDTGLPVTGQPSREALAALDRSLASTTTVATPAAASEVAAVPPAAPAQPTVPAPAQIVAPRAPTAPVAALPQGQPPASAVAPVAPASQQPVNLIQPEPGPAPAVTADESLIFLIQHRLRQAGFSPGRFDGRMSDGTASAIRAYQQKNGLPANGIPSRALLERLEADVLTNGQKQPLAPTPLGFLSCGAAGQPPCAPPPA